MEFAGRAMGVVLLSLEVIRERPMIKAKAMTRMVERMKVSEGPGFGF